MGAGTYKSDPETHFYLSDYVEMIDEVPDMQRFCASLAKLHRDSIPLSPKGQFGFHAVTYNGNKARDVTWCDTWEEMLTNVVKMRVKRARRPRTQLRVRDIITCALRKSHSKTSSAFAYWPEQD